MKQTLDASDKKITNIPVVETITATKVSRLTVFIQDIIDSYYKKGYVLMTQSLSENTSHYTAVCIFIKR